MDSIPDSIPVNVFIDLSKAFGGLDHIVLLSKFKFYGVTGVSLDLMSSYLSNRRKCTQFNTTLSDFLAQNRVYPRVQYWILSCSPSTLNDLPSSSNLFEFLMYNDNTTLYCSMDKLTTNNINIVINEHLDKVNVWMNLNKLVLTLSDPGYFRQLTIRGGGFKSPPPPTISKTIMSIFTISYM